MWLGCCGEFVATPVAVTVSGLVTRFQGTRQRYALDGVGPLAALLGSRDTKQTAAVSGTTVRG